MNLIEFIQSDKAIALITSCFIFFITILLVIKRWISFPMAFLLLFFALLAGLAISNQKILQCYVSNNNKNSVEVSDQSSFKKQILQAMEDLENEVEVEQDNLRHLMKQVEEIFEQVEAEKVKLKQFIEQTKEKIAPEKSANTQPSS